MAASDQGPLPRWRRPGACRDLSTTAPDAGAIAAARAGSVAGPSDMPRPSDPAHLDARRWPPLLVAVFFLPVAPFTQNVLATVLFVAAAITGQLDGWLGAGGRPRPSWRLPRPGRRQADRLRGLVMLVDHHRGRCDRRGDHRRARATISALRSGWRRWARASVAVHSIGKFRPSPSWSRSCCSTTGASAASTRARSAPG